MLVKRTCAVWLTNFRTQQCSCCIIGTLDTLHPPPLAPGPSCCKLCSGTTKALAGFKSQFLIGRHSTSKSACIELLLRFCFPFGLVLRPRSCFSLFIKISIVGDLWLNASILALASQSPYRDPIAASARPYLGAPYYQGTTLFS